MCPLNVEKNEQHGGECPTHRGAPRHMMWRNLAATRDTTAERSCRYERDASESLIHIHLWLCTTVTACTPMHYMYSTRVGGTGKKAHTLQSGSQISTSVLGQEGHTHTAVGRSSERAHEAHDDKIRATRGRAKHAATAEGATGPRPVRCTNERRAHHETDRPHAHTTHLAIRLAVFGRRTRAAELRAHLVLAPLFLGVGGVNFT